MVQQERAHITRERLVDGAAGVFGRLGFVQATTTDIVKEAGATRGALYFHFQSKEEIARAVIDKEQRLAVEAGTRILALNRPAFETILLFTVDLAERLVADPVVKAGIRLTTEYSNFDPPVRAPYQQWLDTFSRVTAAAVQEGDFRDDVNPVIFARFLVPAYTGIQLVSDTFTGREDLLPRIREMWMFVFPAIVPDERLARAWTLLDRLIPAPSS
jgi:AcrR family transcriptional regulator